MAIRNHHLHTTPARWATNMNFKSFYRKIIKSDSEKDRKLNPV